MVTDHASVAANWRLFCPGSSDDTTIDDPVAAEQARRRRVRAGIPDEVRHREKRRLALDMLDQMSDEWGLAKLPVAGDSGYGDATEFRLGLHEHGFAYVLEVAATTSAYAVDAVPVAPAYTGRGRSPRPGYPDKPVNLRALALNAGRAAVRQVTWRQGTRKTKGNPSAKMCSHFLAIRVRPANHHILRNSDGSLPEVWLIAEWPPDAPEPVKYWLSNMDARTS
jgi:DDE superfamily endonuclease